MTDDLRTRLGARADDALELVDPNGQTIGTATLAACHTAPGKLHRAFSVYLFDGAGRVLVHRRAPEKALWHGHWTNSCCSHPRPGEAVADAAERRVREELGLPGVHLAPRFDHVYRAAFEDVGVEHEYVHVLTGTCDPDALRPDPSEMDAVRWLLPDEVDALIAGDEPTSPWFELAWPELAKG